MPPNFRTTSGNVSSAEKAARAAAVCLWNFRLPFSFDHGQERDPYDDDLPVVVDLEACEVFIRGDDPPWVRLAARLLADWVPVAMNFSKCKTPKAVQADITVLFLGRFKDCSADEVTLPEEVIRIALDYDQDHDNDWSNLAARHDPEFHDKILQFLRADLAATTIQRRF